MDNKKKSEDTKVERSGEKQPYVLDGEGNMIKRCTFPTLPPEYELARSPIEDPVTNELEESISPQTRQEQPSAKEKSLRTKVLRKFIKCIKPKKTKKETDNVENAFYGN